MCRLNVVLLQLPDVWMSLSTLHFLCKWKSLCEQVCCADEKGRLCIPSDAGTADGLADLLHHLSRCTETKKCLHVDMLKSRSFSSSIFGLLCHLEPPKKDAVA